VKRHRNGDPVYGGRNANSGYDESELKKIAETTGGLFFSANQDGDLKRIYNEIDSLEKTKIELRSYATFTEYFIWPTLIGLLLLSLEQLLGNTRYRRLP
jgi:Ca-activated chloride channel family protein